MAKFHMTPDGPKKCSARFSETCHYTHYSTPEGAIAAYEIEHEKEAARDSKAELENRLRNLSEDDAVQPVHDLENRGDLGPSIVEQMQEVEARTGERPKFVPGIAERRFSGPGGTYYFTAQRGYRVEGAPPRIVPTWTLTTKQVLNGREVNKSSESFPLTNEEEGRSLKRAMLSRLSETSEGAWPGDPNEANKQRDASVDSLVNVVNSCETAERGILGADSVGFSNFRESTDDKIVMKADWAESVVEPKNMVEAINAKRYRDKNPEVNIVVQDSMCKRSPNYWTAERDSNGWRVHLTRNGSTEVREVEDMDTLRATVYDFSKNEMGSSEERASRSADNVTDIFGVTEYQVQQQEERVEQRRAEKQKERERDLHEELYGEDPGVRKSGLGKLFNLFN